MCVSVPTINQLQHLHTWQSMYTTVSCGGQIHPAVFRFPYSDSNIHMASLQAKYCRTSVISANALQARTFSSWHFVQDEEGAACLWSNILPTKN